MQRFNSLSVRVAHRQLSQVARTPVANLSSAVQSSGAALPLLQPLSPQTLTSPPQPCARSVVLHATSLTDQVLDMKKPTVKEEMFAVVNFMGTQYKVVLDDQIVADKIEGVDIGQKLNLDQVLLLGSRKATVVGRPTINGAAVVVEVEEIAKDKKVMTLKTRRRKNSRSLRGFRREVTVLRVVDMQVSAEDVCTL